MYKYVIEWWDFDPFKAVSEIIDFSDSCTFYSLNFSFSCRKWDFNFSDSCTFYSLNFSFSCIIYI